MALLMVKICGGIVEAWDTKAGEMPLIIFAPLLVSPLPLVLRKLTQDDAPPTAITTFVVCGFCMTIVWLDLLATEVVALIEAAGFVLGISTSLLGLTVIAIGNSSGDLVANVAAAKGASAKMALASCFGSPLLMNLIGPGTALTLRVATTGGAPIPSSISQICRIAYLFLFIAILCHIVFFPLNGYSASRRYAVFLFSLYAFFILLVLLAEGGLLRGFMCPDYSPCTTSE